MNQYKSNQEMKIEQHQSSYESFDNSAATEITRIAANSADNETRYSDGRYHRHGQTRKYLLHSSSRKGLGTIFI